MDLLLQKQIKELKYAVIDNYLITEQLFPNEKLLFLQKFQQQNEKKENEQKKPKKLVGGFG